MLKMFFFLNCRLKYKQIVIIFIIIRCIRINNTRLLYKGKRVMTSHPTNTVKYTFYAVTIRNTDDGFDLMCRRLGVGCLEETFIIFCQMFSTSLIRRILLTTTTISVHRKLFQLLLG